MLNRKKPLSFSVTFSAFLLLLLFSVILTYQLVIDSSESSDWKVVRNFRYTVKSCEQAEAMAESNFKNGKTRLYFSSGFDADTTKFPYNFYRKLEEDYLVEVVLTGDVGFSYFDCYNSKMDSLLSQKFGELTILRLYRKMHQEKYRQ